MRLAVSLATLCAFVAAALPAGAQQAVLHKGLPALRLEGGEGWVTHIRYGEHEGEPVFVFAVNHVHSKRSASCDGLLYVSQERIVYDPVYSPEYRSDAFSVPRTQVKEAQRAPSLRWDEYIRIVVAEKNFNFQVLYERGAARSGEPSGADAEVSKFFADSVRDFDAALEKFQRLTAGLQPKPKLLVVSNPGGAVLYVNNQPRGRTGSDGTLLLDSLEPGRYRLRLHREGYQDWVSVVQLDRGEEKRVETTLSPVARPKPPGPPALSLDDVLTLLAAGVTPVRMATLVKERGVSFQLTDEAQQKLRLAGATDELLMEIAKAKK